MPSRTLRLLEGARNECGGVTCRLLDPTRHSSLKLASAIHAATAAGLMFALQPPARSIEEQQHHRRPPPSFTQPARATLHSFTLPPPGVRSTSERRMICAPTARMMRALPRAHPQQMQLSRYLRLPTLPPALPCRKSSSNIMFNSAGVPTLV
ncbi:hypothetical protein R3P38DRAFT_3204707 [Favolaschia claudopus]|uniref:Uncharacterized protein n=1 Tax=Favolaschia claudopus TaxID=2862362 RepID=A0AAW0AQ30_9AGAR